MGCSSCRAWPEHYRKCIFMEDLLQLPTGEGRGTGVCSVNGQLRAVMWIPPVKLNWFALCTTLVPCWKKSLLIYHFPLCVSKCVGLAWHVLLKWGEQQTRLGIWQREFMWYKQLEHFHGVAWSEPELIEIGFAVSVLIGGGILHDLY